MPQRALDTKPMRPGKKKKKKTITIKRHLFAYKGEKPQQPRHPPNFLWSTQMKTLSYLIKVANNTGKRKKEKEN